MKTLSIRQPWAWLIMHAGKAIENRTWKTGVRGRIYVHASLGMTKGEWEDAVGFAHEDCGVPIETLRNGCQFDQLVRGAVVGSVELVDCVHRHESPWFMGPQGFVLLRPEPLALPHRCRGQLGFFETTLPT